MDEKEMRRLAVEAATERVVGSSSIPMKHFASLLKYAAGIISQYKDEHAAWKKHSEEQDRQIKEVNRHLVEYLRELARIQDIKGIPGDHGRDGEEGQPGKDAVVDYEKLAKIVAMNFRQPKDGSNAVVDEKRIIRSLLSLLKSGDVIRKEHIFGLEPELRSISNLAGKQYGKDTMVRGGGDTVSAGSNVVITRNAAGDKVINATGGGTGSNVTTEYQLTAVQAGTDVTIALSQLTHFATYSGIITVYRNNIPQTLTLDFTATATVLTVKNADASEIFNLTYSYS